MLREAIQFFRGNYHQVKFKFKSYTGDVNKIYFTVKCEERLVRIAKNLDNGITKDGEWYVITFLPEDTNDLSIGLDMIYDIEILINDKPFTIAKGAFVLEEDITRPTEEV